VQKQRLIFLVVGIILGLVAIAMVRSYITDKAEEAKKQASKALEKLRQNQAVVLVAKQDIPADTAIQPSMVESSIVPREYVSPQAATSLDSVSGMITVAPISRGEQINLNRLSAASQLSKRKDLASITPVGKRAITVHIDNIADVSGLIKPGSNVDLIAVLPMPKAADSKKAAQQTIFPAFQNVLLLAVGQEIDPNASALKGQQREKIEQVTVALDPTEASILAFLQDQGKIRISLRSANDDRIEEVRPVTWESVLELMPALKPQEEEVETIDIYRGLNKEKIVVSQ
jgi:pilus assembly protein CpaB